MDTSVGAMSRLSSEEQAAVREQYATQKKFLGAPWENESQIANAAYAEKLPLDEYKELRKMPLTDMYRAAREKYGSGYDAILSVVDPEVPHMRRGTNESNNKIMDNLEIEAHRYEDNAAGRHLGIVGGGALGAAATVAAALATGALNPVLGLLLMVGGFLGGGIVGDRIEGAIKKHASPELRFKLTDQDLHTAAMMRIG